MPCCCGCCCGWRLIESDPVGPVADGTVPMPEGDETSSILYPGGRNVLKPRMRLLWPRKSSDTRLMTPGVSILRKGRGGGCAEDTRRHHAPAKNARGSLERLHDFEKAVVNVRLGLELGLDLWRMGEAGVRTPAALGSELRGCSEPCRGTRERLLLSAGGKALPRRPQHPEPQQIAVRLVPDVRALLQAAAERSRLK
jgi:hypothetical protein